MSSRRGSPSATLASGFAGGLALLGAQLAVPVRVEFLKDLRTARLARLLGRGTLLFIQLAVAIFVEQGGDPADDAAEQRLDLLVRRAK